MPELRNHSELTRIAPGMERGGNCPPPFQGRMEDVLVQIFFESIYADSERGFSVTRAWERSAPMNVTAVCRHWRTVALSSPSLWADFRGEHLYSDRGFPWKWLDIFLHRSQNLPFNLTIRTSAAQNKDFAKLVDIFSLNQARFKEFFIFWYWGLDKRPGKMLEIELDRLPLLEFLHLLFPEANDRPVVYLCLSRAPRLRHLFLDQFLYLGFKGELHFPRLSVAEIRATRIRVLGALGVASHLFSWHDCLLIMQASPSLESFKAENVGRYGGALPFNAIAIVPKLSFLQLTSKHCEDIREVLDKLSLPSLTELRLVADQLGGLCGLETLLSRVGTTVRHLSVHNFNASEAAQCLKYLPALQKLLISGSKFVSADMRTLILNLTMVPDSRVCPKLEEIKFVLCGDPSVCSEELTEMMCSRRDPSIVGDEKNLKSVAFEAFATHPDLPLSARLIEVCREGLVISVYGTDPGQRPRLLWRE